jgi:hypothetical protein
MTDLGNLLGDIHLKDGILGLLVVWLLWTDRKDRKADREFWSNHYKPKNEEKK